MFDHSTAAYDRIVIDDPDAPSSQPEQYDEEEDVPHLLIDSERHKMALDHSRTACGLEWHASRTPFLEVATWKSDAHLCVECFPEYERGIAAQHQADERRESTEYQPLNFREWLNTPAGNPKRKR